MARITLPSGRDVDLDPNPTGSTTGVPSNIPAVHPPGWDPAYGGAPDIPNPIASAWQALGGNMDLLPSLFSLGNAYNLFNYDQRLGQVQGTPGFSGVASNLAGQLPQDVVNQLAQRSAERGISTGGAPDSPNLNAAYLRSLGLNSLDLQNRGQQQLGSLLGQFQQAAPYNLMSGLVSSEDQQAANAAAGVSAAAPNPRSAADEEQRKLLEAIEAGKRAAGAGGPAGSSGIDVQKIIDAFNAAQKRNEPGVAVGRGPSQTINTGSPEQNISQTPNWQRYVDPGAAGTTPLPGRPNDVVQQAFAPSTYQNFPTQGMGLNPALNAVTQSLGNTGIQFGGGPTNANAAALPDDLWDVNPDAWNWGGNDIYDQLGGASDNDFYNSIFGFDDKGTDIYDQLGGTTSNDFYNSIFGFDDNANYMNEDYYNPDAWDWGLPTDSFADYYSPA